MTSPLQRARTQAAELASLAAVTLTPIGRSPHGPQRFALIGEDTATGGVGGWESFVRPRRAAGIEWTGTPLWQLEIPLLIDGMERVRGVDVSCETVIRILQAFAVAQPGATQPMPLAVTGPLLLPRPGMQWVIQDIAWGTRVRNAQGVRVQQEFSLTLLEFTSSTVLLSPAARARAAAPPKKATPAKPGAAKPRPISVKNLSAAHIAKLLRQGWTYSPATKTAMYPPVRR